MWTTLTKALRWAAGPVMALGVAGSALLAIELAARSVLGPRERAFLARVGLDGTDSDHLRWLERTRSRHRSGMAFDVHDPLLGWRPRAGLGRTRRTDDGVVQVTTDAVGLRGATSGVPEARTPGTPRVAVFGCSQTFGGHVDDADVYTARLAAMIPGAEVLNFGVHGYGTDQMLLRWETEGVRFQPDVVVLAFAYYHLARNATAFRFFAKPHFTLAEDGTLTLHGVPVPSPEVMRTRTRPSPTPVLDDLVVLRWLWDRHLRHQEDALYEAESEGWALTRAIITRFARSVRDTGARFVILNVGEEEPTMDAAAAALAAELDVAWIDSHSRFEAVRAAGLPLRVPDDPHWGPHGHAAIAEGLYGAVCGAHDPLPGCGDPGSAPS